MLGAGAAGVLESRYKQRSNVLYIGLGVVGEKIHILVPLCNSFVQLNAPNKQIRDGFKYCLEPLNLSDISDSTKL